MMESHGNNNIDMIDIDLLTTVDVCKDWIEDVTKTKFKHDDFQQELYDGIILCKLMKEISPTTLPDSITNHPETNFELFINACKKLGMKPYQLFQFVDFKKKENVKIIANCIQWLAKKAQEINLQLPTFDPLRLSHNSYLQQATNNLKYSSSSKDLIPLIAQLKSQNSGLSLNSHTNIKQTTENPKLIVKSDLTILQTEKSLSQPQPPSPKATELFENKRTLETTVPTYPNQQISVKDLPKMQNNTSTSTVSVIENHSIHPEGKSNAESDAKSFAGTNIKQQQQISNNQDLNYSVPKDVTIFTVTKSLDDLLNKMKFDSDSESEDEEARDLRFASKPSPRGNNTKIHSNMPHGLLLQGIKPQISNQVLSAPSSLSRDPPPFTSDFPKPDNIHHQQHLHQSHSTSTTPTNTTSPSSIQFPVYREVIEEIQPGYIDSGISHSTHPVEESITIVPPRRHSFDHFSGHNPNERICSDCRSYIYLGENALSYKNSIYCPKCLCGTCSKPFYDQLRTPGPDQKNYCENCICNSCKRTIQGQYVPSGDSKFCLLCVCHFCRSPLKSDDIPPLCSECRCSRCKIFLQGKYYPGVHGERFCGVCMQHITSHHKPQAECFACSNTLQGGPLVDFAGNKYHIRCFFCVGCNKVADKQVNGKLYCSMCTPHELTCYKCGKALVGAGVEAMGNYYHESCFSCQRCFSILPHGNYNEVDGYLLCTPCVEYVSKQNLTHA